MGKEDFFFLYKAGSKEPSPNEYGTPRAIIYQAERVIDSEWEQLTHGILPTRKKVAEWVADIVSRFAPYNSAEVMDFYNSLALE